MAGADGIRAGTMGLATVMVLTRATSGIHTTLGAEAIMAHIILARWSSSTMAMPHRGFRIASAAHAVPASITRWTTAGRAQSEPCKARAVPASAAAAAELPHQNIMTGAGKETRTPRAATGPTETRGQPPGRLLTEDEQEVQTLTGARVPLVAVKGHQGFLLLQGILSTAQELRVDHEAGHRAAPVGQGRGEEITRL